MAEVARMLTVEDTGKGFGAQDLGFIRWKEKKWRGRGGKESSTLLWSLNILYFGRVKGVAP